MIRWIKRDQYGRRQTDTTREKQRPGPKSAPRRHEVGRKKGQSHPIKNRCALANRGEDGSEQEVKEWHVVIEKIAILNKPVRPTPDDVQMLRLVAVESVIQESDRLGRDKNHHKNADRDKFRSRDLKIIPGTSYQRPLIRAQREQRPPGQRDTGRWHARKRCEPPLCATLNRCETRYYLSRATAFRTDSTSPTEITSTSLRVRLSRPASTPPGPSSMNRSQPRSTSRSMQSTQRTVLVT